MEPQTAPLVPGGPAGGLAARARGLMEQADRLVTQPALRRALPAIAVLTVVALGLILYLALSPADRISLQNGLPEGEKARAMEVLQAQGFDARLDPSTGALTVAAAEYHRARMALAAEGLPQGAPDGMAAISDMPLGTSRSVEAARLRRMLELDLAQSIAELQPVRAARVHLALPERSAFLRDREEATASVVVQLAPGQSLSAAQVRAIVGLVAGAVPEMAPDAVSVVDQSGRLLSTPEGGDALAEEGSAQFRQRRDMEQMLRERILALVTPIVGTGNAAVEVTLDMDFTRSELMREDFMPEATALRSEQGSQDGSARGPAMGIPGAVANSPPPVADLTDQNAAPDAEAAAAEGGSVSYTRNYEVSRQVETRMAVTPTITRISAAVLLRAPDAPEGETAPDTALIEMVQTLTRTAIGFDDTRGDQVTVSASAFVPEDRLIDAPSLAEASWLPGLGRTLAQLAILAIIILGVVRPLLSRILPQAPGPSAMPGYAPVDFGTAIEVGQGESLSTLRARLSGDPEDGTYEAEPQLSYEEKVTALRHLGQTEAGRIASVISGMLAEGREGRA